MTYTRDEIMKMPDREIWYRILDKTSSGTIRECSAKESIAISLVEEIHGSGFEFSISSFTWKNRRLFVFAIYGKMDDGHMTKRIARVKDLDLSMAIFRAYLIWHWRGAE